jgi:hypothetical protein
MLKFYCDNKNSQPLSLTAALQYKEKWEKLLIANKITCAKVVNGSLLVKTIYVNLVENPVL